MSASCQGCTRRWTSLVQAHCSVCHRHFGSASLFDRHRRNDACLDPQTLWYNRARSLRVYVDDEGIWRFPKKRSHPSH